MKKYKILLLDADDTVFDFEKAEHQAFFETAVQCGIQTDEILYARYSAINSSLWRMLERGEITKKALLTERFRRWLCESGQTGDAEQMNECYLTNLAACAYLFDDSEQALKTLSEQMRIYFITNGNDRVQRGRFARSPVMRYITDFFISGEIGYEKPDKRYFDAIIGRIPDFDRDNVLVAGDSPTSDLAGAIGMGFDCCYVNRRRKALPAGMRVNFEVPDLRALCKLIGKEN